MELGAGKDGVRGKKISTWKAKREKKTRGEKKTDRKTKNVPFWLVDLLVGLLKPVSFFCVCFCLRFLGHARNISQVALGHLTLLIYTYLLVWETQ